MFKFALEMLWTERKKTYGVCQEKCVSNLNITKK